jgi:hypothetical protein
MVFVKFVVTVWGRMSKKTLSEWLMERRVTPRAFGQRIGMTQASVWRIAAGLQLPRRGKRQRILDETDGEVDCWDEITLQRAQQTFKARASAALANSDVAAE